MTLLPDRAMCLLQMCTEINLTLVACATQLTDQRQSLSLLRRQKASIQRTLVEGFTPNFCSIRQMIRCTRIETGATAVQYVTS